MVILNELMRDLICWLMLLELFEEMLMLSASMLADESRKNPMSLEVTTGLVHGDCSGVVWQL